MVVGERVGDGEGEKRVSENKQHKNDAYGDIDARSEADAGIVPPIPAATVVLLREGDAGPEVLMLKKNSKITFGGMWVFPGGKIDAEDAVGAADEETTARNAAAREAMEEAALRVQPADFVYFAHWTPPPAPTKRFTTWFFAAAASADHHDVVVDDGEIKDHAWVRPSDMLDRHVAGEVDLVPPTWVTLYHLNRRDSVAAILDDFGAREARVYQTRVAKDANGVRVAMWQGDAGYAAWDASVEGTRHRLNMAPEGFSFQHDDIEY